MKIEKDKIFDDDGVECCCTSFSELPHTKDFYESLHTKQLLQLRSNISEFWDYRCEGCPREEKCFEIQDKEQEILREVLSTREHVLNKKESKELRKLRKKRGYK